MTLSFVTIPRPRHKSGSRGNHEERLHLMTPSQKRTFAYNVLGNAMRYKRLVNQPCCVCGDEKSHAHHESYDDPYTITFLCPKHHMARHCELGWGIPKRNSGKRKDRLIHPKPMRLTINVNAPLEPAEHEKLSEMARAEGRSKGQQLRQLLLDHLKHTTPRNPAKRIDRKGR